MMSESDALCFDLRLHREGYSRGLAELHPAMIRLLAERFNDEDMKDAERTGDLEGIARQIARSQP